MCNKALSFTYVFNITERLPELLNEVHNLIESTCKQFFILTGSSARKLRRAQANMLGGRAWTYSLFPLSIEELGNSFHLKKVLAYGSLPPIASEENPEDSAQTLRSYVDTYLSEEIKAEALTRNLGGFVRFLNVAAQTNGEQLNYTNVARANVIRQVQSFTFSIRVLYELSKEN